MDKFCDSGPAYDSDLRNWAALFYQIKAIISYNQFGLDECSKLPPERWMIVFDTWFHVFELVKHGKHVYKFAQCEQVGLAYKFFFFFGMTKPPHLGAKSMNRFTL